MHNCRKKIEVPGDLKFVRCSSCGNRALFKKLRASFIGEINFQHSAKNYTLTVFPEVLNKYFGKVDIVNEYWSKTDELDAVILE